MCWVPRSRVCMLDIIRSNTALGSLVLCGAQTSMIVIRIMLHYTFIVFLRLHLAEYFPIFETVYNNLAEYLRFNSELGFPF